MDFAGIEIDGHAGIQGKLVLPPGLGMLEAVGFAVHLQDVDVVGQPIEQRAG